MNKWSPFFRWSIVITLMVFGIFFSLNLSVNDNALDLLPGEAIRGDLELLQRLGLVDRIFITLSVDRDRFAGEDEATEALKKSSEDLGAFLQANDHFSNVLARLPQGYELQLFSTLWPYLPVLYDKDDLTQIEGVIAPENLAKIMRDNFLRLNSPAGIGLKKQVQKDPIGLTRFLFSKLTHLRAEFSVEMKDGFLMSRDGRNCLVLAESTLSLTDSKNAEKIQHLLEKSYGTTLVPGVEPRVIGTLPHTLANSRSVQGDLKILLPVATVLLVMLLWLTLRSFRALFVLSVPFMAGPPAIAITSAIFGDVSALALGFGIVLLGIAVDFSIHLYLALSCETGGQEDILRRVSRPILFATLTTTSVFCVLLFSAVPSHRQMATLALTGLILAVFFAWLVIPTIASPKKQLGEPLRKLVGEGGLFFLPKFQKTALGLWLLLLVAGAFSWPQLQYNGDLRVLDVPDKKVIADEQYFNATWGNKGDQAFIVSVGKNLEEALNKNSQVYRFLLESGFDTFQSIAPLLPGPRIQQENRDNWTTFWSSNMPEFKGNFMVAAKAQGFSDHAFTPFFTWLDREPDILTESKLLSSPLQAMMATMVRTPASGSSMSGENEVLVMSTVAIDDDSLPILLSFAGENEGISVVANRKWRSEVEKLLRKDIVLLSLVAGFVVLVLVAFQFRKLDVTLAVLAPVVSALAAMSVFCRITGAELNMMHLIMGIMVIGLSVDYGIFVVCSGIERVGKTASMAVSICACSSLIGFGVLAFANHPALHSLGITVLVGIGAAWPVALFVSPSLIKKRIGTTQ